MNILLYCEDFLTRSMTFVYNTLQESSKYHKMSVGCLHRANADLFPLENVLTAPGTGGLHRLVERTLRKLGVLFVLKDPLLDKQLRDHLRCMDLVHAHFGPGALRVYPLVKELGLPMLVTFHGYDASILLRNPAYLRSIKHLMTEPKVHALTVSNTMKQVLAKHGVPVDRVTPLYLGVDSSFFDPDGVERKQDPSTFIFLQVSNFVEVKGHRFTVEAFAKFLSQAPPRPDRTPRLVLAGDGTTEPEIEKLVRRLGISESVEFVGPVDRFQVRNLMASSQVFVQHSVTTASGVYEGLPTVLMEAMSMGLPILSSRHSAIPELVRNEQDGILLEERDVDGYAAAMRQAWEGGLDWYSPEDSRRRIIDNFELSVHCRRLDQVYRTVIRQTTDG